MAYATGKGGSLYGLGFAADIVAMSKVKQLSFINGLSTFGNLVV
ncbi:hypothetical protein [Simiduia aestuariiviva]|uniref:Uncharacterized protein n=1 Tax=Simiduia aestuariiviva TaxID=1510459 RepID=A0A839UQK9_9GAMM|nr:hypothetical protein [Simiduia aestuariiviva]MBB3167655.1 hypothetical protein [Simiduia aestuariiviva]